MNAWISKWWRKMNPQEIPLPEVEKRMSTLPDYVPPVNEIATMETWVKRAACVALMAWDGTREGMLRAIQDAQAFERRLAWRCAARVVLWFVVLFGGMATLIPVTSMPVLPLIYFIAVVGFAKLAVPDLAQTMSSRGNLRFLKSYRAFVEKGGWGKLPNWIAEGSRSLFPTSLSQELFPRLGRHCPVWGFASHRDDIHTLSKVSYVLLQGETIKEAQSDRWKFAMPDFHPDVLMIAMGWIEAQKEGRRQNMECHLVWLEKLNRELFGKGLSTYSQRAWDPKGQVKQANFDQEGADLLASFVPQEAWMKWYTLRSQWEEKRLNAAWGNPEPSVVSHEAPKEESERPEVDVQESPSTTVHSMKKRRF